MAAPTHLSPVAIKRFFARLPEPRRRHKRIQHPLLSLIVIALCAVIAGADTWEEIARFGVDRRAWLAKHVPLAARMPSADTFARVFAALDPIAFQKCLLAWVGALHEVSAGRVVAIDGKVAREAMARAGSKGPLCLVSAWASANQVVLGQVAAPQGSNELGALPALLELLDLHGAIVTLDALGCQKDIVATIVAKHGDYVIAVKDNQERLLAAVQEYLGQVLDDPQARTRADREECHGRREERIYAVADVPDDFPELAQWPGLRSIGLVAREYTDSRGQVHTGVRYYISSLPARLNVFARAVRSHWLIENQLHWRMDVIFREDQSRARLGNEPANFGILRRVAFTLLKHAPGLKGSINCKRRQAGWNEQSLETILFAAEPG